MTLNLTADEKTCVNWTEWPAEYFPTKERRTGIFHGVCSFHAWDNIERHKRVLLIYCIAFRYVIWLCSQKGLSGESIFLCRLGNNRSPELLLALQWRHKGHYWVWNHKPRRLFTQPFTQAQIKETMKAPRHWPLWGESWAKHNNIGRNFTLTIHPSIETYKYPISYIII